MTMQNILESYDDINRKRFDEHEITSELKKIAPEKKENIDSELLAEMMAFDFIEDYPDKKTGWGTYFGPMMVWSNGDGTATESPSIKLVTPEMLDYWEKRAKESKNPILISRYSGLVWDFYSTIKGINPSYEICRIYISALINQTNGDYQKYEVDGFKKLQRALSLSIQLNDNGLVEKCKDAIIAFEERHSQDSKPGLWGYAFDLLVENKRVKLSNEEERKIIKELEDKLKRLSSDESGNPDPWAAESAAKMLAIYYSKKKNIADTRRVLTTVGKVYEKAIEGTTAMQATGWLQQLYGLYSKFNLTAEAEELLIKIRKLGPDAASELKPISHSIDIPRDKIEAYIEAISEGSINEVLTSIAVRYIPLLQHAKEQVLDLSKNAPMVFLFKKSLQDDKGRVVANIGSLEEDLEGHIVTNVSQNLSFSSLFLRLVFEKIIDKHQLDTEKIINYLKPSVVIQSNKLYFIRKALDAFFEKNYIVTIHILVPQIEDIIRYLLEQLGGNILKPTKNYYGGFNLRTLGDVLGDDKIKEILGEDFSQYLRVLLIDQRGWNLRNKVCHGIANEKAFNSHSADRLVHVLLCLGMIQKK